MADLVELGRNGGRRLAPGEVHVHMLGRDVEGRIEEPPNQMGGRGRCTGRNSSFAPFTLT